MFFELFFKLSDILKTNDTAHKYLVHDLILRVNELASLVFVQGAHEFVLSVSCRWQNGAIDGLLKEHLLAFSIDIRVRGEPIKLPSGHIEFPLAILDHSLLNLVVNVALLSLLVVCRDVLHDVSAKVHILFSVNVVIVSQPVISDLEPNCGFVRRSRSVKLNGLEGPCGRLEILLWVKNFCELFFEEGILISRKINQIY